MSTDLAKDLKNISEKDRKQIEQAQEMLGPDPTSMGFLKNVFWGNFREELVFPYPATAADESARCDQLLARLDEYLRKEHPSIEIDQKQEIPTWVIQKLFDLGVLGMTIPKEFGGGGFGITSYNRALERIGRSCGSTAVLVSAHQSIGCKAVMLFGTDDQRKRFLPRMAKDTLSAFCLSEPNVGCDAGNQETRCELSADGSHYILNGEKKWATSGALSGLFTVMAKQKIRDPKSGKEKDVVTALICTPDMEGVEIFSRNRSKCGIRGTWQARIRLTNVKVPRENLLAKEGQGFKIAMSCLNFGRCTLSAGMLGGASFAYEQACKWAKYRYQFDRAIGEFDLVKEKLARMAAYTYAMDAMLYMTTGFLDRGDSDIMLETAMCKVFCSEFGYRVVNDCVQIMGGESYMTENHVERIWRDSRINIIVEGANEVMHSFIFAYGSKQLGEWMLGIRKNPMKSIGSALQIGSELFLGVRRGLPTFSKLDPRLSRFGHELMMLIREFSHQVKLMFKEHEEKLVTAECIHERLSMAALWIHAMTCSLSKLDRNMRSGLDGADLEYEMGVVEHLFALGEMGFDEQVRLLRTNADRSMRKAADAALRRIDTFPASDYAIPEKTPVKEVRGTGRRVDDPAIPQFGSGSKFDAARLGKV
ncbi:MAG: acyl-CoA dehydrogenase family protein [Phycisphaeraceae bacterium]|nr:acyl-CoA dehydrogenase family protein [Phycisphaeraceae bacterium]